MIKPLYLAALWHHRSMLLFVSAHGRLHIEEIPSDSLYRGNNTITLAQAAWNFVHPSKYDE